MLLGGFDDRDGCLAYILISMVTIQIRIDILKCISSGHVTRLFPHGNRCHGNLDKSVLLKVNPRLIME